MSYESKIGPKVTPGPAREASCSAGSCKNSCSNSCSAVCEVGGGHTRITPEGNVK